MATSLLRSTNSPVYSSSSTIGGYDYKPMSDSAWSGKGMYGQLGKEITSAYNQAQRTNAQRYVDILGGFRSRYDEGMGYLQGAGDFQRGEINRSYDAVRNSVGQQMTNRGLYGSSLVESGRRAVEMDRQRALGALNESLRNQYLSTSSALSGDTLGFMERRTDEYPDIGQLGQLATAYGESQNQPKWYDYVLGGLGGAVGGFALGGVGGAVAGALGGAQSAQGTKNMSKAGSYPSTAPQKPAYPNISGLMSKYSAYGAY